MTKEIADHLVDVNELVGIAAVFGDFAAHESADLDFGTSELVDHIADAGKMIDGRP